MRIHWRAADATNRIGFSKTAAGQYENNGAMVLPFLFAAWLIHKSATIDLSCTLDPEHSSMQIAAAVTWASQDKPTEKTNFTLADQMAVPKVQIVEPADLAGETTPVKQSAQGHDVTYAIDLPKPLAAGQRLKAKFQYSSVTPNGFVYLLSPKECLAGGYNTCWFPSVGDSRHMLGTLEFKSPAGFVVKASGKEIDATEQGDVRTSHFQILSPTVPTFAAAKFIVTHVAGGAVPMTLYLLRDRRIAKEYAGGCSRILDVLTKQNGPYPFPDFSIIETPSPESSRDLGFSGASFEGFMFADSDGIDSGFSVAYYGHEIGHQWWGNLIGLSGSKGAYMLSEALAQYGSLQCVSQIDDPALAARYRFQGYPGYNDQQCARGAIMYGPTDADRPVSQMPSSGHDVVYHRLANSKGFLVWDTIARQIGRERFHKALRAVTSKYAWGRVTFDQFLDEIRKAAGRDIDPILSQWLDRTGAPVLWSDWKASGSSPRITLHQSPPTYVLNLPVVIELRGGGRTVRQVDFSTEEKTIDVAVPEAVVHVEIDPTWEVFHSTPDLQAEALDLKDYTMARFAQSRGKMADAEAACLEGLKRIPSPDKYAVGFLLHATLGGFYRQAGKNAEAKTQLEAAINSPTRLASRLPWVYFQLGQTLRALGDAKGAEEAIRGAESADAALPYPSGVASQIADFRRSSPGGA